MHLKSLPLVSFSGMHFIYITLIEKKIVIYIYKYNQVFIFLSLSLFIQVYSITFGKLKNYLV